MTCPFLKRNGEGMDWWENWWEDEKRWGVGKWEERKYGKVKGYGNWTERIRGSGNMIWSDLSISDYLWFLCEPTLHCKMRWTGYRYRPGERKLSLEGIHTIKVIQFLCIPSANVELSLLSFETMFLKLNDNMLKKTVPMPYRWPLLQWCC